MRIKLLPLILLTGLQTYAQSGAHIPSSAVQEIFFSNDGSRCLTVSYEEAILWDYKSKKPIWIKKANELGGFKNLEIFGGINADPGLNYIIKKNPGEARPWATLVNLNTFTAVGWGWGELQFASDGRIPVIQPNEGRNQNILYLINPQTLEKEKIADKLYRIGLINNKEVIVITKQDKSFHEQRKDNRYYSIKERKFVDGDDVDPGSYYNTQLRKIDVRGRENDKYNKVALAGIMQQGGAVTNTIKCKDQDDKEVKSFPLVNARDIGGTNTKICFTSTNDNIVKVLEHKRMADNADMKLSYVNTYNYLTGQLIESFELTSNAEEAIAVAKANITKGNAALAEKRGIDELPQNVLQRRINALHFNNPYLFNTKTMMIYRVVPEKGVYQGNMAYLEGITSKGNVTVYENIDVLENTSLFKRAMNYKTCAQCQGKGTTSYEHVKETDQTLSKGRIITTTTTTTNRCKICGGCGLEPVF